MRPSVMAAEDQLRGGVRRIESCLLAGGRRWLVSWPRAIDQDGRKLGVWRCPLPANIELSSNLVMDRLLVQNFIAAPAPVFRRDTWLSCGGLDEKLWYTADWDIRSEE